MFCIYYRDYHGNACKVEVKRYHAEKVNDRDYVFFTTVKDHEMCLPSYLITRIATVSGN